MRTLRIIGIGPGDPRMLTIAARDAIAATEVFFVIDKGEQVSDLIAVRAEILAQHASSSHRVVALADPPRDRMPGDYETEVRRWHLARAAVLRAAIQAHLPTGGAGAILVWGDPALYDSTIRIVNHLAATDLVLRTEVVPGVTSLSVLTAAHGIAANRIGEPIYVTTGRRLAQTPPGPDRNQFVMLDARCAFRDTASPDDFIWWGAYLGMPEQILIAGTVGEVGNVIAQARERARAQHGWIMDLYLLRKP